jgi:hypothetical protein
MRKWHEEYAWCQCSWRGENAANRKRAEKQERKPNSQLAKTSRKHKGRYHRALPKRAQQPARAAGSSETTNQRCPLPRYTGRKQADARVHKLQDNWTTGRNDKGTREYPDTTPKGSEKAG